MKTICRCDRCERQYDSDGVERRFRCLCGHMIAVREAKPHTSAVIRCSSCGGSRVEGDDSCGFCGAFFTIHEKDLDTVCPKCVTRIGSKSKFCHHCGLKINPVPIIKKTTDRVCPVCLKTNLFDRQIGVHFYHVLECNHCAGIWIDHDTFRKLEQSALKRARNSSLGIKQKTKRSIQAQNGPFYRKCPECLQPMSRRNYGGKSAVIIDVCAFHGIWFDDKELQSICSWIEENSTKDDKIRRKENEEPLSILGKSDPQIPVTTHSDAICIDLEDVVDLNELIFELFSD